MRGAIICCRSFERLIIMKKLFSALLSLVLIIMPFFTISSFAWDVPEFMLAANYNAKAGTICVEYRLLKFAGTESADFRLKYNTDVLELIESRQNPISSNVMMEIGDNDGVIAIQFVDLEHVEPKDCEEDGGATIASFDFKVKDKDAESAVFIATADSCNMDPDSKEVSLDRATLKFSLKEGDVQKSTKDGYTMKESAPKDAGVKKVVVALIISFIAFAIILVAVVVYYRKKK